MISFRDLLNSRTEKLEIKMNPDGGLFVLRLKKFQVKNLDDVNKVGIGRFDNIDSAVIISSVSKAEQNR